jgi:predicted DNA-binding protein
MARKSNTSWQVKRKYNERVYSKVQAEIPKEIGERFKDKCKEMGISQASVILEAIEKFLEENE